MIRRWPITSLVLTLALVAAAWWFQPGTMGPTETVLMPVTRPQSPNRVTPASRRDTPDVPVAAGWAKTPDGKVPGAPPVPNSLRDTDSDGALEADRAGHLIITPEVRRFFDYHLSTAGEEPMSATRQRLRRAIEERLPAGTVREATDLLEVYLRYRELVAALPAGRDDPAALAQRVEQLRNLRRSVFGERVAAALFGEEDERDTVVAEMHRVAADESLSPEQRRVAIEELEEKLPPTERQARQQAFGPLRMMQDEQALRDAGGSEEEVRLLREQRFGADAADRLSGLDREQREWKKRYDEYRAEFAKLGALSGDKRAAAIATLRGKRFNEQERIRVEALDQIQPN